MGELKQGSPLRVWAGEKERTDLIGVIIYGERLPDGVSRKQVRKSLLNEIERIVKNTPYSYWVSPKARSLLGG